MRTTLLAGCPALLAAALVLVPPASAAVPASLSAPANCEERTEGPLDYVFCDDGVPGSGGESPNVDGEAAITVPAAYGGDGYTGLPGKAGDATSVPGSDPAGDIALDVDVSLPRSPPPADGYPLVFMMHGCCAGSKASWEAEEITAGGQQWHYSNAWFASRGYVVVTYTSRGFVNGDGEGSTGQAQLDSRSFEINDMQSLACQVVANASAWDGVVGRSVAIDPGGVVATGGSYGGGFSWMAVVDPRWTCNADSGAAGTEMALAAAAPRFGWTDLVESLVPTGQHSSDPGDLPDFRGCDSGPVTTTGADCGPGGAPLGVPKTSIVAGLYASGSTGIPPGSAHTTFPPAIDEAFVCLNSSYPLPPALCDAVVDETLPEFLRERSAYYQQDFFDNIASDPSYRVPIFSAGTNTDPLFPPVEHRRMLNRILATVPSYPIQSYHGDYQHFTQDKAKEWADLCGSDRHICEDGDYAGGGAEPADFNADPGTLANRGVNTRLNRFLDHYARPAINAGEKAPAANVTASLQVCPENAAELGVAPDEPGPTFTATSFERLAPETLTLEMEGSGTTTNRAAPNPHAANSDPVANSLTNGGACPVETGPAGPGVATFTGEPLTERKTMVGATHVQLEVDYSGPSGDAGFQLDSRLYDVFEDGTAVMVDRGVHRTDAGSGAAGFELRGNGWRFEPGHRIRIEIAQDDEPHVAAADVPSSARLSEVALSIPVREGGSDPGACANRQRGTPGNDRLRGTNAGDLLVGLAGDDRLTGRRGDDCLRGKRGADSLDGGPGFDTGVGGRGSDRVRGRRGPDIVSGGRGADTVAGAKGRDEVAGNRGEDVIRGGKGRDILRARDGKVDIVNCGAGKRDRAIVDRKDVVRNCERINGRSRADAVQAALRLP